MVTITAQSVVEENVGKRIAKTKVKKCWSLLIDNTQYQISFFVSKRSRKIRIFINDRKMVDKGVLCRLFEEKITVDEVILEFSTDFKRYLDLKINGVDFNCIYYENDLSVQNQTIVLSDINGEMMEQRNEFLKKRKMVKTQKSILPSQGPSNRHLIANILCGLLFLSPTFLT